MLHVALGVAAGMAHAKGTGQCCGGGIDIPKVRIFQNCLIFTPMNDTTVRLFMYPQVVKKGDWRCYLCGGPTCYTSEQQQHGSFLSRTQDGIQLETVGIVSCECEGT